MPTAGVNQSNQSREELINLLVTCKLHTKEISTESSTTIKEDNEIKHCDFLFHSKTVARVSDFYYRGEASHSPHVLNDNSSSDAFLHHKI